MIIKIFRTIIISKTIQVRKDMYKLIEQFSISKLKNGTDKQNEDSIFDNSYYGVVSDGATTQKGTVIDGLSPGKTASTLFIDYFKTADPYITFERAISDLEDLFQKWYKDHEEIFHDRITTSSVVLNKKRKELWFLGDCSARLDNELYCYNKEIDTLTTNLRVFTIQTAITEGQTSYEECLKHDIGRDVIIPLIEKQQLYQNNNDGTTFCYGVMDGYKTIEKDIHVMSIPENTTSIILTSDGYPVIEETLEKTEKKLSNILKEDPLMIGKHATTKGLSDDKCSFDDRSYLRYDVSF
jgi:hypothetical protein